MLNQIHRCTQGKYTIACRLTLYPFKAYWLLYVMVHTTLLVKELHFLHTIYSFVPRDSQQAWFIALDRVKCPELVMEDCVRILRSRSGGHEDDVTSCRLTHWYACSRGV